MPQRTISTRLAISGESEYRQALRNVNSELKRLNSELNLVKSEYQSNANSMEALQAKAKALANAQAGLAEKVKAAEAGQENAERAVKGYESAIESLTKEIKDNEKALEDLQQSDTDTTAEQEKLTKETDELKLALAEAEKSLAAAKRGVNDWQVQTNKAKTALNDLNEEIKDNDKYIAEAQKSADGYAKSIDQFGNKAKEAGDKGKAAFDAMSVALIAAGVDATLDVLSGLLQKCATASIEFESAMAGVAKTTNLSGAELDNMGDKFKMLSTQIPVAANELAGLAEIAGQLGVQNIVEFTEVIAKLGTATNLTAEDAATMLAQFANITGLDEGQFENLGSAIVDLGNKSATTESAIMEMAQRFASAGSVAGLSETDILGFSAALSSLGIEAEAGGSALSTLVSRVQLAVESGQGLSDFAAVAGMSAQEFRQAWAQDAAGALTTFITGLNNTTRNGKSAIAVLNDMGITEVRLRNAVLSLSESGDLLTDSLNTASGAFESNTALAKEAETRYATTESKLQMFYNSVTNLESAFGDQLNPMMQSAIDLGRDLTEWATEMIEENEWLAPVITAVGVALGVVAVALAGYTVATKIAEIATAAFGSTLNGIPIFAIITAITALVAAVSALAASMYEADDESKAMAESTNQLTESMEQSADAYQKARIEMERQAKEADILVGELEGLISTTDRTRSEQVKLETIVGKLNEAYPDLGIAVDQATGEIVDNTGKVIKNTDAIRDQLEVLQEYEEYIAIQERLAEVEGEISDAESQLAINNEKVARGYESLTEAQQELFDKMADGYIPTTLELLQVGMLTDENFRNTVASMGEVGEASNALNDQLEESVIEQDLLNQELKEYNDQQLINTYGTAELTAEQQGMVDKATELKSRMDALKTAYDEAYASAYESISGQIGMWEKMDNTQKTSVEDTQAILDSQVEYLSNYGSNLQGLMDRNIDGVDKLASALSDGSTESAAILAGLSDATDEEIEAIVKSLGEVEEGKNNFSTIVAEMETDFTDTKNEILGEVTELTQGLNQYEAALEAGDDTGQGYADGLRGQLRNVRSVAGEIARAVDEAIRKANEISSPSKLMKRLGKWIGEGYEMGLKDELGAVNAASQDLAKSAYAAYDEYYTPDVQDIENTINYSRGNAITVNVPFTLSVSQSLSDSDIKRKAKTLANVVSAEIGRRLN